MFFRSRERIHDRLGDGINSFSSGLKILLILSILLLSSCTAFVFVCSGSSMKKGDWFEYKTKQVLKNGRGEYDYYDEEITSHGRYEVWETGSGSTNAKFYYEWEWKCEATATSTKSGRRTGVVEFDRESRQYLNNYDLDEYAADPKFIWFYIPTPVSEGQRIKILDRIFEVTDTDTWVMSDWLPREVIELTATGSGRRSDEYGFFSYTYTDKYYFEAESGYIVAERYYEEDIGYGSNAYDAFDLDFELDVTDSSYHRNIFLFLAFVFYIIIPVGIVLLVYGIYYLIRWSSKSIDSQAIGIVKVKRITSPKDLPPLTGKSSRFFEPFYENMILKAVKAKDTAAVAVSGTHGVVGFGVYHKDVDIGSIFAPETDVNETIRSFLGCKDFFSETRHKPVRPRAQGSYAFMIGGPTDKPESYYAQDVYNIFETYKVLINRNLFPVEYDRNLIRPMRQEDLPAIAEISKKVYKVDGMKWYSLLLQMGEIGLVAELKGQIVGYTFITVCDNHARFHTNTVDPAMQNKGIGKELMKARISIAYHLGCTDAMCEIADWNLPSLQIALSHGFVPEGKMYVETIRTQKVEKKFIRR